MVVALQSNNTQLTTAITQLHFPLIYFINQLAGCVMLVQSTL